MEDMNENELNEEAKLAGEVNQDQINDTLDPTALRFLAGYTVGVASAGIVIFFGCLPLVIGSMTEMRNRLDHACAIIAEHKLPDVEDCNTPISTIDPNFDGNFGGNIGP